MLTSVNYYVVPCGIILNRDFPGQKEDAEMICMDIFSTVCKQEQTEKDVIKKYFEELHVLYERKKKQYEGVKQLSILYSYFSGLSTTTHELLSTTKKLSGLELEAGMLELSGLHDRLLQTGKFDLAQLVFSIKYRVQIRATDTSIFNRDIYADIAPADPLLN